LIAATAEMAWPESKLAVISAEMTQDLAAFVERGWRVFGFRTDGLSAEEITAIISLVPPKP
jgi:hypothetical protein